MFIPKQFFVSSIIVDRSFECAALFSLIMPTCEIWSSVVLFTSECICTSVEFVCFSSTVVSGSVLSISSMTVNFHGCFLFLGFILFRCSINVVCSFVTGSRYSEYRRYSLHVVIAFASSCSCCDECVCFLSPHYVNTFLNAKPFFLYQTCIS